MDAFDILLERGVVHQVTDEAALRKQLQDDTITLYAGFDPTADSLHLGHLFPLLCLTRFQKLGHKPIALVGGATGLVGDPSGKNEERQLRSEEEIDANVLALKGQMERFLDFEGANAARIVNNADWTKNISFLNWLRDIGKYFSVNVMTSKESVRRRLEDPDKTLSYTEFSYMLIQANDFLALYDQYGCTLQVGGSDQWGNITAGIDLVQKKHHKQVYGITFPLLTNSNGEKFGKSEGNAVWLDAEKTSPYSLYQFWLNTDDRDVIRYLKYFTFLPIEEINELEKAHEAAPEKREAHEKLAIESTRMIHGEAGLERARYATEVMHKNGDLKSLTERELADIFKQVPSSEIEKDKLAEGVGVLDLMTLCGISATNSEARRLVKDGGAYLNNEKIEDGRMVVNLEHRASDSMIVLRRGKKKYFVVNVV